MSLNVTAIRNAIPTLFGDSIVGKAMTGLVRIPAFLSNLTAVAMVAELTIRTLRSTLSQIGIGNDDTTWISRTAEKISESGIRPYRATPTKELVIKAIAFAALGVAATEFVNIIGGQAPAIYNNVLTFLGPIRIDNASYFTNIRPFLAAVGVNA